MLEIRGIWHCHMSRWDRYVLRPQIWMETSRSGTVPHIGPYTCFVSFDDDVVDVDLDVSADLVSQACLHHPLVRGSGVFQSEGHCSVAEYAIGGDERGVFFIFFLHPDLVVS